MSLWEELEASQLTEHSLKQQILTARYTVKRLEAHRAEVPHPFRGRWSLVARLSGGCEFFVGEAKIFGKHLKLFLIFPTAACRRL